MEHVTPCRSMMLVVVLLLLFNKLRLELTALPLPVLVRFTRSKQRGVDAKGYNPPTTAPGCE
jgi:hypothetical protein